MFFDHFIEVNGNSSIISDNATLNDFDALLKQGAQAYSIIEPDAIGKTYEKLSHILKTRVADGLTALGPGIAIS